MAASVILQPLISILFNRRDFSSKVNSETFVNKSHQTTLISFKCWQPLEIAAMQSSVTLHQETSKHSMLEQCLPKTEIPISVNFTQSFDSTHFSRWQPTASCARPWSVIFPHQRSRATSKRWQLRPMSTRAKSVISHRPRSNSRRDPVGICQG